MGKHIKRTGIRAKYEEVKALPWTPRARAIGDWLSALFTVAGFAAWVAIMAALAGR